MLKSLAIVLLTLLALFFQLLLQQDGLALGPAVLGARRSPSGVVYAARRAAGVGASCAGGVTAGSGRAARGRCHTCFQRGEKDGKACKFYSKTTVFFSCKPSIPPSYRGDSSGHLITTPPQSAQQMLVMFGVCDAKSVPAVVGRESTHSLLRFKYSKIIISDFFSANA